MFGLGAIVVEGEKVAEDFFAGSATDGVADSVSFGKDLDLVKVMLKFEILPAIGVTDGLVELLVQSSEFEKPELPLGLTHPRPPPESQRWMS